MYVLYQRSNTRWQHNLDNGLPLPRPNQRQEEENRVHDLPALRRGGENVFNFFAPRRVIDAVFNTSIVNVQNNQNYSSKLLLMMLALFMLSNFVLVMQQVHGSSNEFDYSRSSGLFRR